MKYFVFSFLCVLCIASCYYDNEEELYPNVTCDTTNMSYSKDIVPILVNNNCISCHGETAYQGNVSLATHLEVVKYVTNKSLVGSITHATGYKSMPLGAPKMNACSIYKIEAWITQGSQNN
jgi:mono/diheme cytochrome c family protein